MGRSLAELVAAGYLKQLPDDPYSAGPLIYRRRGDDFILYSVAKNFTDDDGRWVRLSASDTSSPKRSWGRKDELGDKVFWPVARANGDD